MYTVTGNQVQLKDIAPFFFGQLFPLKMKKLNVKGNKDRATAYLALDHFKSCNPKHLVSNK